MRPVKAQVEEEPVPQWQDELADINPEALTADGFNDAYVGWIDLCWGDNQGAVACYSRRKCIEVLMRDGPMSEQDAEDYFEFNVAGAYVGPYTPLFLTEKDA